MREISLVFARPFTGMSPDHDGKIFANAVRRGSDDNGLATSDGSDGSFGGYIGNVVEIVREIVVFASGIGTRKCPVGIVYAPDGLSCA